MYFTYHGSNRVSVEYKGNTYYYLYNLQGDVVGLVDSNGSTVVSYTYDAWGNPESTTGSMASTLGAANPFRYRSYYFDTESGLYYLMSRYYDPVVGRFLNADAFVSTGQGPIGDNMFVYCLNNPISMYDMDGVAAEAIEKVGALGLFFTICAAVAGGPVGGVVAAAATGIVLYSIYTDGSSALELPELGDNVTAFPPQNNNKGNKVEGPVPIIPPIPIPKPKKNDDPPGDTIVYRWAAGRNSNPRDYRNLTPRPWSDNDGLSFSLVPTTSRGNARTTLAELQAAGFICTVSGTHVSVMPSGGQAALASWKDSYETARTNPHELTLLLYAITR